MNYWIRNVLLISFIFFLNGLYSQNLDSSRKSILSSTQSMQKKQIHEYLNELYQLNSYSEAILKAQQFIDQTRLENDSSKLANTLLLLGIMQQNKGDNSEAFKAFLDSYAIFKSLNNKLGVALVMDHLGSIFRYHGSLQKSFEYHSKSYEILKKENNTHWLIPVLNNLGIINRQLGNNEVALKYSKRSLNRALIYRVFIYQ